MPPPGLTAVKPNYHEVLRLLGPPPPADSRQRAVFVPARGAGVLEATGARVAAVTPDTEGAPVFEGGLPPYRTFARPKPHSRAGGGMNGAPAQLASLNGHAHKTHAPP
jgi:D-beta-D-heptose 7-phosphate kinase/D-beta-D-heptose 1-phosphate adenosyltransferase